MFFLLASQAVSYNTSTLENDRKKRFPGQGAASLLQPTGKGCLLLSSGFSALPWTAFKGNTGLLGRAEFEVIIAFGFNIDFIN